MLVIGLIIAAAFLATDGFFQGLQLLGMLSGEIATIVAIYHFVVRPVPMQWGATSDEITKELPGDELSETGKNRSTRGITICAPAEEVWPWLVQVGWERGDFIHTIGWKVFLDWIFTMPNAFIPSGRIWRLEM